MDRWQSTLDIQASVVLAVVGGALWAASPAPAQGLPQHMVAYMAAAGQTDCPDNWTEAAYAQGRLILGTTDGSQIQKLAGTPASDAQPPQHAHTFKVTGTVDSASNLIFPGGNIPKAGGGEATSTGTTRAAPIALPFIQFLVCEQMAAESVDSAPYGTVAFFNAQACPENWAALDQADGRFLLPAFSSTVPLGYATPTRWDPANPPAHTHGLHTSFETQSAEYELFVENWGDLASSGNYKLSGTTTSGGPALPFVSLLVCEKEEGVGNSEGVPLGTMTFFGSADCPDDWGVTIGANGRFVMGIGGNGTQGATFGSDPIGPGETSVQHEHGFSGAASPPASGHPGAPPRSGFEHGAFVTTAESGYSGTSGEATSELPYLVLQSCTYTAGQDWEGAGRPGRQ